MAPAVMVRMELTDQPRLENPDSLGMECDAVFRRGGTQPREIVPIIVGREEHRLPIVAALDHMQRLIG